MKRNVFILLLAVLIGGGLRLPRLDIRPMHTDEAVHAVKFGALLEQGVYRYDRAEYHGPTLNYLTLLPAWLTGRRTLIDVDETTLRIVPAGAGILLILLLYMMGRKGSLAAPLAAFFAAVSPAMTFYSRYYIQEMLLVLFSVAFLCAAFFALQTARARWAAAAGIAAGLMYATKETSIIAFGVCGLSLLAVMFVGADRTRLSGRQFFRIAVAFVLPAALVIGAMFSSFGTNLPGIIDAFSGWPVYLNRAGDHGPHIHPWYYYVSILFWSHDEGFPVWTEATILVLGVLGLVIAWKERNETQHGLERLNFFFAVFTVLLFAVLSVIPYKTPWVILTPFAGLIVMAGIGGSWLLERGTRIRLTAGILMILLGAHLAFQAYAASFVYAESPANPYVYAQAVSDVRMLGEKIHALSPGIPGGPTVQVIVPEHDYWPLPWYFRDLSSVGWWDSLPESLPRADVYVTTAEQEAALAGALYRSGTPGSQPLFVPLVDRPIFLRPGKEIRIFARLDLVSRTAAGGAP
jgi:uncharacterized protein (TIGR03663 family)